MDDRLFLDALNIPRSWRRGEGDWTGVVAAIARGETVEVIQEIGSTSWQESLPAGHSLYLHQEDTRQNIGTIKGRIWISFTQRRLALESALPKVQLHPRVLWVGIGCQRGTPAELIATAVQQVCRAYHLAASAIAGIATINSKANETGIIELCQERHWLLKTFAADILSSVAVPNPANFAVKAVGTPSVAEAAAISAVSEVLSTADDAAFICCLKHPLLVPKKIVRSPETPASVTVAVAVSAIEYLG
ncbi:MAG: cobalamin biosynthesis protein CbiG [Richelia sp. CSU_2_1]|nr:cobalamin biosynthesis protein CbiG [Microcoleus sp. SU_5_6]NJR22766.1 cobalamin biosynthesis protein CbiG [Richelia sp. CSU_2_1]